MPRIVEEIALGQTFSRSSEEGAVADSSTRTFRVVKNSPDEYLNISQACGINIGDVDPGNPNIACVSLESRYDGDSRMVLLCTFQFRSAAGGGGDGGGGSPSASAPDVRPSNVATSTTTVETPAYYWYEIDDDGEAGDELVPAFNPADDIIDGVTYLKAMTTITVEQYEPYDPTRHCLLTGSVNEKEMTIGSLKCEPRSILFRGVTQRPVVESWGKSFYRGWLGTYEFLHRPGNWDLRIPLTGFNVKAFDPAAATGVQDPYGQPLKHMNGKIVTPLTLADGITVGEKVRAMVRVHDYENAGSSQLPSAQPIALNLDGTPRKGKPIIKRRTPYKIVDLVSRLSLRVI